MDKKAYAKSMLEFLNAAPTPFQSIELLRDMLAKADAIELQENAVWNLEKGKLYYFEKDGSQLVAFRMGTESVADTGFRMSGAHHDYPGFRIKPAGSQIDGGIERVTVEPYGGMIVRGWFDRPLSVAGRLCVRADKGIKTVNVNVHEPLLIIPSLAIHL
ncbi:MAG: M18 family aminopeptidase, partial [Clostridia bacterium]|nr:M18 family aminopeptidase [Clostridia bacterium]